MLTVWLWASALTSLSLGLKHTLSLSLKTRPLQQGPCKSWDRGLGSVRPSPTLPPGPSNSSPSTSLSAVIQAENSLPPGWSCCVQSSEPMLGCTFHASVISVTDCFINSAACVRPVMYLLCPYLPGWPWASHLSSWIEHRSWEGGTWEIIHPGLSLYQ